MCPWLQSSPLRSLTSVKWDSRWTVSYDGLACCDKLQVTQKENGRVHQITRKITMDMEQKQDGVKIYSQLVQRRKKKTGPVTKTSRKKAKTSEGRSLDFMFICNVNEK